MKDWCDGNHWATVGGTTSWKQYTRSTEVSLCCFNHECICIRPVCESAKVAFFLLFILVTVAGKQQRGQVTFCSDNVELTWMEGDLKVLWSREYWYKTVRTSLLISVSKNNEGLTPLSVFTPVENTHLQPLGLKWHIFLTPSPSSYLSLASSALPLKGFKPALGDAGLHGEAWPDRPREALRLRLLSKPRFLLLPSRLTRLRSLRPVGGGWLSSSPSSCCSVIWGKHKSFITFNSWQILELVHISIHINANDWLDC